MVWKKAVIVDILVGLIAMMMRNYRSVEAEFRWNVADSCSMES